MSVAYVNENLDELVYAMDAYQSVTGKSREDVAAKAGKSFSFFYFQALKRRASKKGEITESNLAALKGGRGILVSDRAKEIVAKKYGLKQVGSLSLMTGAENKKRGLTKSQAENIEYLNVMTGGGKATIQAIYVEQELKLRESHRMFSAIAAVFKGNLSSTTFSIGKGGVQTGRATPKKMAEENTMTLEWGPNVGKWSAAVGAGLLSPSRAAARDEAIAATRADMWDYVNRKKVENARKASKLLRRALS